MLLLIQCLSDLLYLPLFLPGIKNIKRLWTYEGRYHKIHRFILCFESVNFHEVLEIFLWFPQKFCRDLGPQQISKHIQKLTMPKSVNKTLPKKWNSNRRYWIFVCAYKCTFLIKVINRCLYKTNKKLSK